MRVVRSLNIYVTCSRNFLLTAGKSTNRPIMMEKPHYTDQYIIVDSLTCVIHIGFVASAKTIRARLWRCWRFSSRVFFRRLAFVRNPRILECIRFIAIISLYLIDLRLSRHWWNRSSSKRNWNNARLITFAVPIHIVCINQTFSAMRLLSTTRVATTSISRDVQRGTITG